MSAVTKIQWADHTFNPWRGCEEVSPACDHCYAKAMSGRNPVTLGEWGPGSRRALAAESYWNQPRRWNRQAEAAGVRRRVFCLSLGDVFEDRADLVQSRERLWRLIQETPALDWLLLTKRPAVALSWSLAHGWPENAWAGVTVEDVTRFQERVPLLKQIPARVRFLSMEPLLESFLFLDPAAALAGIHWVIIGGESGLKARRLVIDDVDRLVSACREAGVAPFVKQLGARPVYFSLLQGDEWGHPERSALIPLSLRDPKGGDPSEWPERLRVREFPVVVS